MTSSWLERDGQLRDSLTLLTSSEHRTTAGRLAETEALPASPGRSQGRRRPPPLPAPLSVFIGRQSDLAGLSEALSGARLVTVCGPAGTGKTRLALELARRQCDDDHNARLQRREQASERDDVWMVELASLDDDT